MVQIILARPKDLVKYALQHLPIDYVVIDSLEIILYLLHVRTVNLQADVSVQLTQEGASSFGA